MNKEKGERNESRGISGYEKNNNRNIMMDENMMIRK